MKQKRILLIFAIFLIFSCKPVKYTYTNKDGVSQNRKSYTMAGDKKDKKNTTYMTLGKFNKNDINKYYYAIDSMEIQEITVEDLKTQFKDYDYTLISVWYPCNSSMVYEIKQFADLVDTLRSVSSNQHKMAYVFAGLSYYFHYHDLILKSFEYHLQPYIIPSSYHKKVPMKRINFLRELNTTYYSEYNDDVSFFSVLVLDNRGEVIKMIDYKYTEKGYKVMKNYKAVRDELLELVK